VAWGCVDFDEGEATSLVHALNLYDLLRSVGLEGVWIERSRSKGYHVWVFATDWTPAITMRRLLIGACQVVAAPHREVNPKSEYLADDQLGNFVRLPYKGCLQGPIERQVVVDVHGQPIPLERFVSDALDQRVTPRFLQMVANTLYIEPQAPTVALLPPEGPWLDRLNTLARIQLEEGPRGNDRSAYLMAFGHACAESGLLRDEIVEAVRLADQMHTHKYEHRRDAEKRYGDIADRGLVPSPDTGEYDYDEPF